MQVVQAELLHYPAAFHHRDFVADGIYDVHFVSHDDDRNAEPFVDLLNKCEERACRLRID